MICNKTQCQALTDLTGSERFTDWVGRVVILAPATAQNGKPTLAIRPAPAQEVARPASESAGEGSALKNPTCRLDDTTAKRSKLQ